MKNKNVLVVINLFSSAKIFVGGQFKYLSDNGYKMHLICSNNEELKKFAQDQGIEYLPVTLNRQLTPFQDIKSLLTICKFIRNHKINCVIGHQAKGRLLATIAGFLTKVPHIVIFAHGAIFETSHGLKRKILILENKLESYLSDKVVCVSRYVKELRIKEGIDRESKQIIPGNGTCGGIDTVNRFNPALINQFELSWLKEQYGIQKDDFIIGFVGRLVKDKGIIELISGFRLLQDRHPDKSIKLMIVGPPEKRDGLPTETLNVLCNSKDIIYVGKVKPEEMPIQYCCMDCLILPSHREGFGFCNLEAQAMGTPVITNYKTGCRDSISNNKTGLYIDVCPESIADKIEMLFDEGFRKELSINGPEWVQENFDHKKVWPHIKHMLDKLYEKQD